MPNNIFACRVCGYISEDPPWGVDEKTPLYDYCVCCGVERGYQDATPFGAKRFREKWLSSGAKWHNSEATPLDWNLTLQLENIPDDFL
jgi:hypothetical protein